MKKLLTTLIAGSAFVAGTAMAHDDFDFKPYAGVEYGYRSMNGKDNYADFLPKKYPLNLGIFVGSKFHENFGAEAGYMHGFKKKRTVNNYKHEIRVSSFKLDLNGYLPLENNFQLVGTLGIGYLMPKYTLDGKGYTLKKTFAPRFGVGAEYAYDNISFRARALYELTDRVKFKNNTSSLKPFKNSILVTIGAYINIV